MKAEELERQLTSEYAPDAVMDEKLKWSTERINSELPPTERMTFGRYKMRREAWEAQQREAQAAAARAAKGQTDT